MILFIISLVICSIVFINIFPEYMGEIAILTIAFSGMIIGILRMIESKIECIVKRRCTILREELINDIEKLYKCKNLNDVIDWRLDR